MLAGVLAAAALTPGAGTGLLVAYALGLGAPFLLAAFYLPAATARARRWWPSGSPSRPGETSRIAIWILEVFPWLAQLG